MKLCIAELLLLFSKKALNGNDVMKIKLLPFHIQKSNERQMAFLYFVACSDYFLVFSSPWNSVVIDYRQNFSTTYKVYITTHLTYTCFSIAFTLAGSLCRYLCTQSSGLIFKQFSRDPAEKTCMSPIVYQTGYLFDLFFALDFACDTSSFDS